MKNEAARSDIFDPTNIEELKADWAQWLEDLRSGNYKQTAGTLRRTKEEAWGASPNPGHCCLGVRAEALVKKGIAVWVGTGSCVREAARPDDKVDIGALVPRSLGLTQFQAQTFIDMNDAHKNTFLEIADYAEKVVLPDVLKRWELCLNPPAAPAVAPIS